MSAAELSELQLDQLLGQVAAPAAPAPDLAERIAERALRTPQERVSRFSIPRRHSPRRRPVLWTAVIATNLVAAAAAAASWDGQRFDFRRLTDLPHRVAAAMHIGHHHHPVRTDQRHEANRPVGQHVVSAPHATLPVPAAQAAKPMAVTHTSGTIAHAMMPAPAHFRPVRHLAAPAHAAPAYVRIAPAPFAAARRREAEAALDGRAARRAARAAERALLPEAKAQRNGARLGAERIDPAPRQPLVAPEMTQHQQAEPERRAIEERGAAADRSPPSAAPPEPPKTQPGLSGQRRALQGWRQMHPRAREGRGRRRGRF